jgi:hypothetical protein
MATKNMAYDSPVYQSPVVVPGFNAAGAAAKSCRFSAFTTLIPKALQATVVVAGTGTGNCTLNLVKIAAGGTAITTLGSLVTMSTNAAGYTTNILATGTISAGDDVYVQHGADATSVFTLGLECYIAPGANVTA